MEYKVVKKGRMIGEEFNVGRVVSYDKLVSVFNNTLEYWGGDINTLNELMWEKTCAKFELVEEIKDGVQDVEIIREIDSFKVYYKPYYGDELTICFNDGNRKKHEIKL